MSSFVESSDMDAMLNQLESGLGSGEGEYQEPDLAPETVAEPQEPSELPESLEKALEPVADVKEQPEVTNQYDGFVPRSRLNDTAKVRDEWKAKYEALQAQQQPMHQPAPTQPTPVKTDSIDRLLQSIEGSDIDPAIAQSMQQMQTSINQQQQQFDEYQVRQQWDAWNSQTDQAVEHFKRHANIEIPREFIIQGIRGSEGKLHPHQIAENYVKFARETAASLGAQPNTEPQASRRSGSTRSTNARQQTKQALQSIGNVQDAHVAAAAFLDNIDL